MSKPKDLKSLSRMMEYILGRRPDEFGLFPDAEGFVKIKELLKAVGEEPGHHPIRRGHLDELIVTLPNPPIEIAENSVRARKREHLPAPQPAKDLPKLLYTGIRQRAWPSIHDRGLFISSGDPIVLSSDRSLAERMARRKDTGAVILTVQTGQLMTNGIMIMQFGESLFSTREVPSDCFTGPPLPKEKPLPAPKKPKAPATPGSFELDLGKSLPGGGGTSKKSTEKRKRKRKKPPWRQ